MCVSLILDLWIRKNQMYPSLSHTLCNFQVSLTWILNWQKLQMKYFTGVQSFFRLWLSLRYLTNSAHFLVAEVSLPCSLTPVSGHYCDPDKFCAHPITLHLLCFIRKLFPFLTRKQLPDEVTMLLVCTQQPPPRPPSNLQAVSSNQLRRHLVRTWTLHFPISCCQ